LLRRENELSPLRVKDHYGGCFRAVIDEDIRFAVNRDPGFVNGFEGNRPKWFLLYSFQDAFSRHANSKTKDSYPGTAMQVITGRRFKRISKKMPDLWNPFSKYQEASKNAMQIASGGLTGVGGFAS